MSDFATMPRSVSDVFQLPFLGDVVELRALCDALACGGGFLRFLENDLADLALLRLAVAVLALLKVSFGVGVA